MAFDSPFIVTVTNRKGGTAKTTTAVNLAAEWAARGARTLLIDLDPQGHAALGLGVTPRQGSPTGHDVFGRDKPDIAEGIHETAIAGLRFIPARPDFDGHVADPDPLVLSRALVTPELLCFDVIVLDTPASPDPVLAAGLAAADAAVVPLVPHYLAGDGVQQLAERFGRIADTVNPNLRRLALLPVMVDRRVRLQASVLQELARQFGEDRVLRGIRTDIKLAEAFAHGKPVRRYAARTRGAMDYWMLLDELEGLWGEVPCAGTAA